MRQITFAEAIREAFVAALSRNPEVFLIGLGVPDPKGFFGTTLGLQQQFGAERVMDMPCAENGMTGVVVGAALNGMRPILNHQRLDFAVLAMDQLCSQAAKWRYMFGGKVRLPIVVRMILGRGWGQGPQHSQCLHSWFAHIPGLKVVMPSSPYDAKGLLLQAVDDENPVVFIEHRWLHHLKGEVPEEPYVVSIGVARLVVSGSHVTIVAFSYMVIEAVEAARKLSELGVLAEVIDMRSLRPLDRESVLASVRKTGHLVVVDTGWQTAGMAAEIIAIASEGAFESLRAAPCRVCFPDCPTPTSPALAAEFYPRSGHVVAAVRRVLNLPEDPSDLKDEEGIELDKPSPAFTGPF